MKKTLFVALSIFFLVACKTENNKAEIKKDEVVFSTEIKNLIAAVEKNPDSTILRMQLVNTLDSSGFYKDALQHLDKLIVKDSLNYGYWYKKGWLQQNAKDTSGAVVSFKRAIRVYASADALLSLANLYAETKNDSALLYCAAVERLNPDRKFAADCRFIEGVFYARTNKTKEAKDKFDECINTSHTYMVAYMEKGFIFYDEKNYNEALKIFKLAATVNNMYADAYYWQAKCYEVMNNKVEAVSFYQKALALDKTIEEANIAIKRLQ